MNEQDANDAARTSGEEEVEGHLLKEGIAAGLAAAAIAAPAQAKPVPDPPYGNEAASLIAQQDARSLDQRAAKAKPESKRRVQVPKGRHLE